MRVMCRDSKGGNIGEVEVDEAEYVRLSSKTKYNRLDYTPLIRDPIPYQCYLGPEQPRYIFPKPPCISVPKQDNKISDESSTFLTTSRLFASLHQASAFISRNTNISARSFGTATAIWIFFELLQYYLITLLFPILILSLTVLFLWSTITTTFISNSVPKERALLHDIASVNNVNKFLAVIAGLWWLSFLGRRCDFFTLIYINYVLFLIVPVRLTEGATLTTEAGRLREGAALTNEAVRLRRNLDAIIAILRKTSNDLLKSNKECLQMQEENKALVKELAAMKLTCKDLMAKCNILGREEGRYRRIHEKAEEKIEESKIRGQELKTAVESEDNEGLILLEASKTSCPEVPIVNRRTKSSFVFKPSSLREKGNSSALDQEMACYGCLQDEELKQKDSSDVNTCTNSLTIKDESQQKCGSPKPTDSSFLKDNVNDVVNESSGGVDFCTNSLKSQQKSGSSEPIDPSCLDDDGNQSNIQFPSSISTGVISDVVNESFASKEAAGLHLQDKGQVQPSVRTKSFAPLVKPGMLCCCNCSSVDLQSGPYFVLLKKIDCVAAGTQ